MAPQQTQTIPAQQIAGAAQAVLRFFSLDTTLIPGNLRQPIALVELILQQLATGQARLASTQIPDVELGASKPARDEDPGSDGTKDDTPVETPEA